MSNGASGHSHLLPKLRSIVSDCTFAPGPARYGGPGDGDLAFVAHSLRRTQPETRGDAVSMHQPHYLVFVMAQWPVRIIRACR